MTNTNQLPLSKREAFEAFAQNCPMGRYSITRRGDGYDSSHTQLMWDTWQACTQIQSEAATIAVDHFDNAPNTAFTNRIYPPVEIGTKLYTTPQPAQATQADVTDEQIINIATQWSNKEFAEGAWRFCTDFARAILALRPAAVPMTEDQVWHNDALMSANGIAGFKMDALMRIVRAVEAHHGITALRPAAVPMTDEAKQRGAIYWAPEYRCAFAAGIAWCEAHHFGITAQAKKEGAR